MAEDLSAQLNFWRTLALALVGAFITGVSGWLLLGVDNVKHSELGDVLEKRSPYTSDKQRIWDSFEGLRQRDKEIREHLLELDGRLRNLEKKVQEQP